MSLASQLLSLTVRVANEFNAVRSWVGGQVSTLLAAINGKPSINDSASSTTSVYSSSKVDAQIVAKLAELVGAAPAALDTIYEIAAKLQDDDVALAGLNAAVAARVRFDAAQTLTAAQMVQALANIGAVSVSSVGDTNTDFVARFEQSLNS